MNRTTRIAAWFRSNGHILGWIALAGISFHLSYLASHLAGLSILFLFGLIQLARAETWRKAFYPGLAVGLIIAAGRLDFFWQIFSAGAIGLWLVFAFWIGLFVVVARAFLRRFNAPWTWLSLPMAWCGLEFYRSELYYLKFAWLTPGFAFAELPSSVWFKHLGVYGMGLILCAAAAAAVWAWTISRARGAIVLTTTITLISLATLVDSGPSVPAQSPPLRVAGVQLEFPSELEVLERLNRLVQQQPETDLVVLSEYTFMERVPKRILRWCAEQKKYLVAGGKEPLGTNFLNTAYVVSPEGEIVFQQVKSVPIQFFKDGLPAAGQEVWESPWGKLGICICYDLSYTRVTDQFVKRGAQALIVPTMDVADWGERQHQLHGRVAPVRAAEYGIPVFRIASSGISQAVDGTGRVNTQAPFPGEGAVIAGLMTLPPAGTLPLDRWAAPLALCSTLLLLGWIAMERLVRRFRPARTTNPSPSVPPGKLANQPERGLLVSESHKLC